MTDPVAVDRTFADRFLPEIQRIIGPYLLTPSTVEQDRHEATDLTVLIARDVRIACRVRRPGYADRYPGQFTVRSIRTSGTKTELEKFIDGWCDWFFYGHAVDANHGPIDPWWIIDLAAFRSHLIRRPSRQAIRCEDQTNGDGTCFRAYVIASFPAVPRLIVACSPSAAVEAEVMF
jgi:hypothetical protein